MATPTPAQHALLEGLIRSQLSTGGWSYGRWSLQAALEPTCLALLCLRSSASSARERGVQFLLKAQHPNGSWPAFAADDQEGSWVTALAVICLVNCAEVTPAIERGLKWLLSSKGREAH